MTPINIKDVIAAYSVVRNRQWKNDNVRLNITEKHPSESLYMIYYLNSGTVISTINGKKKILKEGSLILYRGKDKIENEGMEFPTEFIGISFVAEKITGLSGEEKTEVFDFYGNERIRNCVLNAVNLYQGGNHQDKLGIKINIMEIIDEILMLKYGNREMPSVISDVLLYMDQMCFEENINIKKLAEDSGFNYEYFIRLFKYHVGYSPKKYINMRRLERFKFLVEETNIPISYAASESGFFSDAYRNEIFKEIYGVSPREYRKQFRMKNNPKKTRADFSVKYLYHIYRTTKRNKWERIYPGVATDTGAVKKVVIALLKSGQVKHIFNGKEQIIEEGNIVIVSPPYEEYINKSVRLPTDFISLSLYFEGAEELCEGNDNPFIWVPENGEELSRLFMETYEMYQEDHITYYNSIIINITKIVREFLEHRRGERKKDVVRKAITYIEQMACTGNINIRELAENAGVSYEHFIRLFKKQTGKSPAKYINDFRLMLAVKFLRFTDEKIGKVALMSGFSDASHLNDAFRKKYGVSPSVFRKSNSDI